jgi:hypothetical protein
MITKILIFLGVIIPLLVLAPPLSYAGLLMNDPVKRHARIQAGIIIAVNNLYGKTGQTLIDTPGNTTEDYLLGEGK